MREQLKLPIGIENFEKIRKEGFYYVDKTGLIKELLENWGEVNLFTRPRRFGKSLNMDMLKYFFGYGCEPEVFEGLEIAKEKSLCETYMGKYPVVSVSLKEVSARNDKIAREILCSIIGREALRFQFLKESNCLSEEEKLCYRKLIKVGGAGEPMFIMTEDVLAASLKTLCELLYKHYGKKVILLIDEYDVPLDKAQQYGYYDKMVSFLRNMLGQALKGNSSLQFAVLTGCLRIAKESIFTGLNNLQVLSITDIPFDRHFGFSRAEVQDMLDYYGLDDKMDTVQEWYDGYRFGNAEVFCPWDVVNYCREQRFDPDTPPRAYWTNTSGNEIIRTFLQKANQRTKRELEQLVDGGCIAKKINLELTYRDLYQSIDHLWSVLFTTGYLTQRGRGEEDVYQLAIPNLEIRKIFIEQILEWFREETRQNTSKLDAFCEAFRTGDAAAVEEQFSAYLRKTISIRDTSVRKGKKENFYHGILLGLLSHREDWDIDSNAESGNGFSDILVEIYEERIGMVIEVKYPDGSSLEAGCDEALKQIDQMGYVTRLLEDGMTTIYKFGIACNRKQCRVLVK